MTSTRELTTTLCCSHTSRRAYRPQILVWLFNRLIKWWDGWQCMYEGLGWFAFTTVFMSLPELLHINRSRSVRQAVTGWKKMTHVVPAWRAAPSSSVTPQTLSAVEPGRASVTLQSIKWYDLPCTWPCVVLHQFEAYFRLEFKTGVEFWGQNFEFVFPLLW